jgi:hypothetical protein
MGHALSRRRIELSDINQVAVDALQQRALELIAERKTLRRRLLETSARDAQVERDIHGCIAGARALEQELKLPPNVLANPAIQAHLNALITSRNAIITALPHLKQEYGLEDGDLDESPEDTELSPEMPRIGEIILDRLNIAGAEGSKAAEIRRFIFNTYDADIHEKTVGMTLYRLQKDGVVRRDGRLWFLASAEAENPGADTPGPVETQT